MLNKNESSHKGVFDESALNKVAFALIANCFEAPYQDQFSFSKDKLILIDEKGDILDTLVPKDPDYAAYCTYLNEKNLLTHFEKEAFLLPGLIDLHCHAPQWPQAGKGLDLPLYDWLQTYTFPLESRYQSLDFAKIVYEDLSNTLIANGTTTAVYFATIDSASSQLLADICLEKGQRAFIGKVNMDNPDQCPDYYCELDAASAIKETEGFIEALSNLKGNKDKLIQPVITPRFIPSCSQNLLYGLGELVQTYDLHMQTHCAESDWARDYAKTHFNQTDIEIYAKTGLLNHKSILAHSIFLTPSDIATIREYQAGIAHCPLSNMYFANAAMHTRELLDAKIAIGLGSDIAGAPSPSIFRAAFDAVSHSRVREEGVNTQIEATKRGVPNSRIRFIEAFWMATRGGALVLKERIGLLQKGYRFDAIKIKPSLQGNVRIWQGMDSEQDILEKIITLGQACDIASVWVQGKKISDKQG